MGFRRFLGNLQIQPKYRNPLDSKRFKMLKNRLRQAQFRAKQSRLNRPDKEDFDLADPMHQFKSPPLFPLIWEGRFPSPILPFGWWSERFAPSFSWVFTASRKSIIPGRVQMVGEEIMALLRILLPKISVKRKGYFPLVFTLFMMVIMGNLLGITLLFYLYQSPCCDRGWRCWCFLPFWLLALSSAFHFFICLFPRCPCLAAMAGCFNRACFLYQPSRDSFCPSLCEYGLPVTF